jgi:hypothetical protein
VLDLATALQFPIATSSFAAQRLLDILPFHDSEAMRSARLNLYRAGDSAARGFRDDTFLYGAFQLADRAQAALAGLAVDASTFKAFTPGYLRKAASDLIAGSAAFFEAFATPSARQVLQDRIRNARQVLSFANEVCAPSKLSSDGYYPLDEIVENCYARGDYPAPWLLEQVGERYAEAWLAEASINGRPLRGLQSTGQSLCLADKTMPMLHAGMGACFARNTIHRLTPLSTAEEIDDALKSFLDLVDDNSRAGYKGAALEALGYVVRSRYIQMVDAIYDRLVLMDGPASEHFWHGAGRAIFFSPMYMAPGFSPFHAAAREGPNDTARLNARAGVAWAFTMANLKEPEIVADFLMHHEDEISEDRAFENGVTSALISAGETVPGHRFVTGFCRYEPVSLPVADKWNRYIGSDCEPQVTFYREMLRSKGMPGEVFRYHSLRDLIASLEV